MDTVIIVIVVAVLMLAAERLWPATRLPRVPTWWTRVVALNAVQAGMVFVAAASWDRWLLDYRLWQWQSTDVLSGALVGYVVITFIYYWWHRARHEIAWLWRSCHQIHHSPTRLEIVTSFYIHPLEIALNSILSSAILYWIVGLTPAAAALATTFTGLAELFYHWNVRTPYWLGFIIQRPESHRVHHQRGLHRYNYSDLPLWDMLFGTFHNPKQSPAEVGFANQAECRLAAMLIGKDVNIKELAK